MNPSNKLSVSALWTMTCSRQSIDIAASITQTRESMRKTLALFILLALSFAALAWGSASASTEKAAVVAVAQNYMDAYYTSDSARMKKTLHPDFHKRTLRTVNGHTEISEDTVQSMLEGVRLGSGQEIPSAER